MYWIWFSFVSFTKVRKLHFCRSQCGLCQWTEMVLNNVIFSLLKLIQIFFTTDNWPIHPTYMKYRFLAYHRISRLHSTSLTSTESMTSYLSLTYPTLNHSKWSMLLNFSEASSQAISVGLSMLMIWRRKSLQLFPPQKFLIICARNPGSVASFHLFFA